MHSNYITLPLFHLQWLYMLKENLKAPQTIARPVLLSVSLLIGVGNNIFVFPKLASVDAFIGKNGVDASDLYFWWTSPCASPALSPYRMISLILTGLFTILFGLFRSVPSCWERERLTDTRRRSFRVSLVFIKVCKQI